MTSPEKMRPGSSCPPAAETRAECLERIAALKQRLADEVLILGHHYQQDDILAFADHSGDSYALSKAAAASRQRRVIFCGVHFMAETADMLTAEHQAVILPDLEAGCSMADMATVEQVRTAWELLTEGGRRSVTPITYINSSAALKAFVGEHGGAICTSSNAAKVVAWALGRSERLFFCPDQHLGRNTCHALGIPLGRMAVYDPRLPGGGLEPAQLDKTQIFLWYGYCDVHQGFTLEDVAAVRLEHPEAKVAVHPECCHEVVAASDFAGSTEALIRFVTEAPVGSVIAVGTEINLVQRLTARFPGKRVFSLSPYQCLCSTMYRIKPERLLEALEAIAAGEPKNLVSVPRELRRPALLALERMLAIS